MARRLSDHRPSRGRRYHPAVEELEPRTTPDVTLADCTAGNLLILADNDSDHLFLTANAAGAIRLRDENGADIPITGSPTLGNCFGVVMNGGGGNDLLDVSGLPGDSRTILLQGGTGNDTGLDGETLIGIP